MTLPALIATDVDGTLLDNDELVSPRTRAAVHAAVDAGTHFVLATGRPAEAAHCRPGSLLCRPPVLLASATMPPPRITAAAASIAAMP